MEQTSLKAQGTLKCKKTLMILSSVSLICIIISSIQNFFTQYVYPYENGTYYKETVIIPQNILSVLTLLLKLAPAVLLVLYVFWLHKKAKSKIIIPIILGAISLYFPLYYLNEYMMYWYVNWFDIEELIHYFINRLGSDFPIPLLHVFITITFALSIISALKGLTNKVMLIIATALGLAAELFRFIGIIRDMDFFLHYQLYLAIFLVICEIIGFILLYISILLFGLKNRPPAKEKERSKRKPLSPEKELRALNEKLELGIITQEEYQSQRAEIIRML